MLKGAWDYLFILTFKGPSGKLFLRVYMCVCMGMKTNVSQLNSRINLDAAEKKSDFFLLDPKECIHRWNAARLQCN